MEDSQQAECGTLRRDWRGRRPGLWEDSRPGGDICERCPAQLWAGLCPLKLLCWSPEPRTSECVFGDGSLKR